MKTAHIKGGIFPGFPGSDSLLVQYAYILWRPSTLRTGLEKNDVFVGMVISLFDSISKLQDTHVGWVQILERLKCHTDESSFFMSTTKYQLRI